MGEEGSKKEQPQIGHELHERVESSRLLLRCSPDNTLNLFPIFAISLSRTIWNRRECFRFGGELFAFITFRFLRFLLYPRYLLFFFLSVNSWFALLLKHCSPKASFLPFDVLLYIFLILFLLFKASHRSFPRSSVFLLF